MKLKILLLILVTSPLLTAQEIKIKKEVPTDTSFTLIGTAQKIAKDFPFARLVKQELQNGVIEKKNVVYCSLGDRKLHLDIYSPKQKDNKKFPGVILIHGGGWRSGDRSMEAPMAQQLALHGYIAATVEYRLSPEAKYPAAIYDLKSAVRWMRSNANKFNIDSSKIAVYGSSSGGHLAAFLGATNGLKKFEGTYGNLNHSSNVQAIINIDGILDFTDPAESGKDNDPEKPSVGKLWLSYSFKERPALWNEASPLNYVGNKTPPIIFINSSIERFHAGRETFIEKLKIYNIYYEVHTIPDTPHTFWLFHPWFEQTYKLICAFLDKAFKGNKLTNSVNLKTLSYSTFNKMVLLLYNSRK
ncbi:MAG: alpha/beta hydrolase [Ignavibacteriales bacterium]|nr:alpha/beta hydrolase [Ignavibacteriales bacterium]